MPVEVNLIPNPSYKSKGASDPYGKDEFKSQRPKKMYLATARENVRNSGGAYKIQYINEQAAPPPTMELDTMSSEQLKIMAFGMGMKEPKDKAIKRSEIIAYLHSAMDRVEVVED